MQKKNCSPVTLHVGLVKNLLTHVLHVQKVRDFNFFG